MFSRDEILNTGTPSTSIILPTFNAEPFVAECLASIAASKEIDFSEMEVCIFDDCSTDRTMQRVGHALNLLREAGIGHIHRGRGKDGPHGVGYARNSAVQMSCGQFLIFVDADDLIAPDRISRQVAVLRGRPDAIVGGNFDRIPSDATPRYVEYHRRLRTETLFVHAFRDAPLVMPTVALSRMLLDALGGFVEGKDIPEDLHLIYSQLRREGPLIKLDGDALVSYRYHGSQTSRHLHRRTLLETRVRAFEDIVLRQWNSTFMIWGAGRDGRAFFRALSPQAKEQVSCWLDVDTKKIGRRVAALPVLHYSSAVPPLVTCVALDRTNGMFEENLKSLSLRPGIDFVYMT